MKTLYHKGYEIRLANQTGGKAGKGCNKTTSIQVHRPNHIVKQFRVIMGDEASLRRAIEKAVAWVRQPTRTDTI